MPSELENFPVVKMSHDVPGGALSTAMILDQCSPPQEVIISPSMWGTLRSPTEGSPFQLLLGASTNSLVPFEFYALSKADNVSGYIEYTDFSGAPETPRGLHVQAAPAP